MISVIDFAASTNIFSTTADISLDFGSGADRALLVRAVSYGDAIVSGGVGITSVIIDPGGANINVPLNTEYSLPSATWGTAQSKAREGTLTTGLPTGVKTVRITCANANTRPTLWGAVVSGVTAVGTPVISSGTGTLVSVAVPSASGRTCIGMAQSLSAFTVTAPTSLNEDIPAITNRTIIGSLVTNDSTGATTNLQGSYTVTTAYSAVGWDLTGTAVPGPTISTQPTSQNVDEGLTASFSIVATGTGSLNYQWQRQNPGGGAFTNVGTNSTSYTTGILDDTADNGAHYQCIVSDDNGSITSSVVALTVNTVATTATITIPDWVNNTGTPHVNGTLIEISFYHPTTKSLVLAVSGGVLSGSSDYILTSSAFTAGGSYLWIAESTSNPTWFASGKVTAT